MVERKLLSDSELDEVLSQVAAAGDMARAAGLELAGEIAAIRAGQSKIEAARLRFKKGAEAPEAGLPEAAATARVERGGAATAIGAAVRKQLDAALAKRRRVDPGRPGPVRPGPGLVGVGRDPVTPTDAGFAIAGIVTAGGDGVGGLTVEARTGTPLKTVGRATTGANGRFELKFDDVVALRKDLGLDADAPFAVTLVARKDQRIVARGDTAIALEPGSRAEASLKLG